MKNSGQFLAFSLLGILLISSGCSLIDSSAASADLSKFQSPLRIELVGSEAENQFDWMAVAGRVKVLPPEDEMVGTKQFIGYIKVNIKFYSVSGDLLVEDHTYIDATKNVLVAGDEKDFVLVRERVADYDHHEISIEKTDKIS